MSVFSPTSRLERLIYRHIRIRYLLKISPARVNMVSRLAQVGLNRAHSERPCPISCSRVRLAALSSFAC